MWLCQSRCPVGDRGADLSKYRLRYNLLREYDLAEVDTPPVCGERRVRWK